MDIHGLKVFLIIAKYIKKTKDKYLLKAEVSGETSGCVSNHAVYFPIITQYY